MPLTPSDVANKQFKIVFRGYSLDEVDGFLDEVESELTRLLRDNNDLRTGSGQRLTPAFTAAEVPTQAVPAPSAAVTPEPGGSGTDDTPGEVVAEQPAPAEAAAEPVADQPVADQPVADKAVAAEPVGEQAVAPEAVAAEPVAVEPAAAEPVASSTPFGGDVQAPAAGDGGRAALRMLQMAQQTAEQAVSEARAEAEELLARTRAQTGEQVAAAQAEAEGLVTGARAEAEGLVTSAREQADSILGPARSEAETTLVAARAEADRLLGDARERSARVHAEIDAKVESAMGDLEARRTTLEATIEQLRAFEREYRTRLKAYLESQLQELGHVPSVEANGVAHAQVDAAAPPSDSAGAPETEAEDGQSGDDAPRTGSSWLGALAGHGHGEATAADDEVHPAQG